jgi:hypothetical protein
MVGSSCRYSSLSDWGYGVCLIIRTSSGIQTYDRADVMWILRLGVITYDQRSQRTRHNPPPHYRSNKEAHNNKDIIGATKTPKHLITSQQEYLYNIVRGYTNWDTTTTHPRRYNRVTVSIDILQDTNRNAPIQTPYAEIRWGHPFTNSIIVNMTGFYILYFYISYFSFKVLTYTFYIIYIVWNYLTTALALCMLTQRIRWHTQWLPLIYFVYVSPEDGHRSGPKHVV